ncbi:hypothetical protein FNV43_RR17068 [Rhamnella rubrinervis]|uniref:Uncharacterized protein n=1 Tax=Rhamnella rubrinervis TaxID=2594499 RepID=A0A8K0GZW6_9ROSA|nr:hypothetical protein FNV43_RR17068 [Rhamnella rubrinervis]
MHQRHAPKAALETTLLGKHNYVKLIMGPKALQDGFDSVVESFNFVNLSTNPTIQKLVSISSQLSLKGEAKPCIIIDMSGLNPGMVCHALNIYWVRKPIKKPRRNFHSGIEFQALDDTLTYYKMVRDADKKAMKTQEIQEEGLKFKVNDLIQRNISSPSNVLPIQGKPVHGEANMWRYY